MNWPVVAVPSVSYSPETSWSFGAGGSVFFRLPSDEEGRSSEVSFDGAWTLNRQWYVNTSAHLYITNRWQLRTKLSYRHYPDSYYGLGNEFPTEEHFWSEDEEHTVSLPYRYTMKQLAFMAEPLYRVGAHSYVGGMADLRYDASGVRGEWLYTAIGPSVLYDKRFRSLYYPLRGLFFKSQALYSPLWYTDDFGPLKALNSAVRLTADFRHYVPLYHDADNEWKDVILAYQLYADMLYPMGSFAAPELMPTLGGQDLLRGIRRGRVRDNAAFAAQAELRLPIWKIFRGCVFAGIGDAYNFRDWHWAMPKVGYGLGLRCRINPAGINLRFDVARSNISPSWSDINAYSFYFTVKEAF